MGCLGYYYPSEIGGTFMGHKIVVFHGKLGEFGFIETVIWGHSLCVVDSDSI